jgi:integrase/recombinase XerD
MNVSRRTKISNVIRLDAHTVPQDTVTWGEATRAFVEDMWQRGLKQYTVKHHEQHLRVLGRYISHDTPLVELSRAQLQGILNKIRVEHKLSATTYNHYLKTIRQVLGVAVKQGHLAANPAYGLSKMKEVAPRIIALSEDQVLRLLKQPDTETFAGFRDLVMMKLMLDCGIRLREMLDLRVHQVDLRERKLRAVQGKNGNIEDIPISKPMCRELERYLQVRGEAPVDSLFITVDGAPLNRRTFQERMHEYGRAAGIQNVRVSPHTLRHTFAKQWILNGGDVFSLQKVLRHSTMDMVRRYVNLFGNEVQKLHDKYSPLVNLRNWTFRGSSNG